MVTFKKAKRNAVETLMGLQPTLAKGDAPPTLFFSPSVAGLLTISPNTPRHSLWLTIHLPTSERLTAIFTLLVESVLIGKVVG
jgi:hypothetical protein